jgi:hypothetical protein
MEAKGHVMVEAAEKAAIEAKERGQGLAGRKEINNEIVMEVIMDHTCFTSLGL